MSVNGVNRLSLTDITSPPTPTQTSSTAVIAQSILKSVSDEKEPINFRASKNSPPVSERASKAAEGIVIPFRDAVLSAFKEHIPKTSIDRTIASFGKNVVHLKTPEGTTQNTDSKVYKLSHTFIGKGAFKKVYEARQGDEPLAFAKTYLNKLKEHHVGSMLNEISFQRELSSFSEFVRLDHACLYSGKQGATVGLMMEYCEQGDLKDAINGWNFDERMEKFPQIFEDFLKGLSVLEEKGIQHRDIKKDNIFLSKDRGKIGDFGLATRGADKNKPLTLAGTVDYMSPSYIRGVQIENRGHELVKRGMADKGQKMINEGRRLALNTKNDLWSAGIILFEMRRGEFPKFIPEVILVEGRHAISDEQYAELSPYLEPSFLKFQEEMTASCQDELDFLEAQNNPNPDDIAEVKAALEAWQSADLHSYLHDSGEFDIYKWVGLITQEFVTDVLEDTGEVLDPFNREMLQVDVSDAPTAHAIYNSYTSLKTETEAHNKNKADGEFDKMFFDVPL